MVKALEKEYGGWWTKIVANPYQKRGLPDIEGLCQGVFFGFEAKRPGKESTVTEVQIDTLFTITRNGGVARLVTTVPQVLEIVGKYIRKRRP